MASTVTRTAIVRFDWNITESSAVAGDDPVRAPNFRKKMVLAAGTGANQVNEWVIASDQTAVSTSDSIDTVGAYNGWYGNQVNTPTDLIGFFIINEDPSMSGATLTIGAASNPLTDFLGSADCTIGPIGPNGYMMLIAPAVGGIGTPAAGVDDEIGYTVGAGTGTVDVLYCTLGR